MPPKESVQLMQVSRWRSIVQVDELFLKQAMQPKESVHLMQVSRWRSTAQFDELFRYKPGSLRIGPARPNQLTKPQRLSLTSLTAQLRHSIQAIRFKQKKRGGGGGGGGGGAQDIPTETQTIKKTKENIY